MVRTRLLLVGAALSFSLELMTVAPRVAWAQDSHQVAPVKAASNGQLGSVYMIDTPAFRGAINLQKQSDGSYDVIGGGGSDLPWKGTAQLSPDGRELTIIRHVTVTDTPSVGASGAVGNALLGGHDKAGPATSRDQLQSFVISLGAPDKNGIIPGGTAQVYASGAGIDGVSRLGAGPMNTNITPDVTIPDSLQKLLAAHAQQIMSAAEQQAISQSNSEINKLISQGVSKLPVPKGEAVSITHDFSIDDSKHTYTDTWSGKFNSTNNILSLIASGLTAPIPIAPGVTLNVTAGFNTNAGLTGSYTGPLPDVWNGTAVDRIKSVLGALPINATAGLILDPQDAPVGAHANLTGSGSVATTGGVALSIPAAQIGKISLAGKTSAILDFGPTLGITGTTTVSGQVSVDVLRMAPTATEKAPAKLTLKVTGQATQNGEARLSLGFFVPTSEVNNLETLLHNIDPSATILNTVENNVVSTGVGDVKKYTTLSVSVNASALANGGFEREVEIDTKNPKGNDLYHLLVTVPAIGIPTLEKMTPAEKAAAGVSEHVHTTTQAEGASSGAGFNLFSLISGNTSWTRGHSVTQTTREPVGAGAKPAQLNEESWTKASSSAQPFGLGSTSVQISAKDGTKSDGTNTTATGRQVTVTASHTGEHNVSANDVWHTIYGISQVMPDQGDKLRQIEIKAGADAQGNPVPGDDYPQFDTKNIAVTLGPQALSRVTAAASDKTAVRNALASVMGLSPTSSYFQQHYQSAADDVASTLAGSASKSAQDQLEAFRSAVPRGDMTVPVSLALAKLAGVGSPGAAPDAQVDVDLEGKDPKGNAVSFKNTVGKAPGLPKLGGD